MMCVSLHYQSKALLSWKHWKSTDVTPKCRLPQIVFNVILAYFIAYHPESDQWRISSISHIKLFAQFFDEQIYQVVNARCRLHENQLLSFKKFEELKYYLLEMKRLLLTLHYGNEMDIFCIAVNEKLFTTLHAPTLSLILVLTITQRCLASQIRRDAVLSM
ncbi:hypothetical protein T02_12802 [Trichinella nativa]|uniref:Uncharacterized protein n=1 Tax=Trichinella nativa TaxID=6335 RepID=A0A0V1KWE0_9BILA|nr:hypothetical protein T02_12802 [Trichinella nativa]